MLDFNLLLTLVSLVGLGAILSFWIPRQQSDMKQPQSHDSWLKTCMDQQGIKTWAQLRQTSGLSPTALNHLRQGSLKNISLQSLTQLTSALNLPLDQALTHYGFSITPATPPDDDLRQECLRLRQQLEDQAQTLTQTFQQETFRELQSLLTNYPTMQQLVSQKPDLPAKNIIAQFNSLDALIQHWQLETIGPVWNQVPFDPQYHQADSPDIQHGESVYIRFVGYRQGPTILCPAKVSRNLPANATPAP